MGRFWWIIAGVMAVGLAVLVFRDETSVGVSNDTLGRLLYLGLFGAVVASGILGSGMTIGTVGRSLAAWLVIIVGFVAIYQYRYELQDVGSRLTAGLIPGSPMSVTAVDGSRTVTLEKRPDGHFEARGQVDGRTVRFLVDTGATTTVLTSADAGTAGFDVGALSFDIPISTANGTARAARVTADELRIGTIVRPLQAMLVAQPGSLDTSLLGMNFLSSLAGYDVRGDRMVLID